jgi:hypothetical protein
MASPSVDDVRRGLFNPTIQFADDGLLNHLFVVVGLPQIMAKEEIMPEQEVPL